MADRARTLLGIEAIALVAASVFTALWILEPDYPWEPWSVASFIVVATLEAFRRRPQWGAELRFATERDRIKHREALRKQFQEEIYRCRAEKLREDVIVRDADRVDAYPETDDEPGISPWFRVGLLDTYERGIVLCLGIGGLKARDEGYRFVDYVNGEESDIKVWLMADVPYDSIVDVNMDGDKYYHYPHIFCHFDFKGEPYERKWFAERKDLPHGHPYFREVAEHKDVLANNPNEGNLFFG